MRPERPPERPPGIACSDHWKSKCEHDKTSIINYTGKVVLQHIREKRPLERRLFRLLKKTHAYQNSSHIPHIIRRSAQQRLALTILVLLLCIRHVQLLSLLHFSHPPPPPLRCLLEEVLILLKRPPPTSLDSTAMSTSSRRRSWRRRRGRASI